MNILFLHGWTSVPGGRKPTHLQNCGHQVVNPALPDEDFEGAVRIAEDALAGLGSRSIDVIVGSSRGGAVALNMRHGPIPLVLLCPAWRRWGTATRAPVQTRILHSRLDDVIPFEDSEELLRVSQLPTDLLLEVGSDHRLADPASLATMEAACQELANPAG